jgi:hypothetical protein
MNFLWMFFFVPSRYTGSLVCRNLSDLVELSDTVVRNAGQL